MGCESCAFYGVCTAAGDVCSEFKDTDDMTGVLQ